LPLSYEGIEDPARQLAETLAHQIKSWIEENQTIYDRDLKAQRAMHAGDVMVLVQTRSAFVDHFVRALKKNGVPVSGVDRMLLTDQLPVMDLMALLQFCLLPQDDLTLACVLRGPLIGAEEKDLMALAIGRTGSLWQRLRGMPAYAPWRTYLEEIAALADMVEPLALLQHVLSVPCPADERSGRRALAGRLGPEAEDPIDEFLVMAENYAAQHGPSLQAFLFWFTASSAEVKRELERAEGRVRITTVHASKGLESPVVILPDTVHVPSATKLPKLMWDGASGLPFYIPKKPQNAFLLRLYEAAREAQFEEYRRLLYVALTRAADRLVVCGHRGEKAESFDQCWYEIVRKGLAPHHQPEAVHDDLHSFTPAIVLADYAQNARAEKQEERGLLASFAPPDWVLLPPPPPSSPPRPLVPSRPSSEEPSSAAPQDLRFARGRIMHKLLQNLPELAPEKREEAALRFLQNPQHRLAEEQQRDIAGEILTLISDPRFAPLFGCASRAEVPIIGMSGARIIPGQIDRLALVGDEVWIVDYKTNRPPPEKPAAIPPMYREQMEAYRTVLASVYPAKKIRCFLLWTYTLRLMEVLPSPLKAA
jgi:ATP-dependent helicase/nuclease subunit A